MSYPTALDDTSSLPNPTGTSTQASPDHAGLHTSENGAIIGLETKLGTGASTAANNKLLVGTGAGTSAWTKDSPTGTIVGTSDTQVLTNKTLTSPTINTATIANPTLTVDAVTGYSVSNTGTLYGISVTTGAISSALSLTSTLSVSGTVTMIGAATVGGTLGVTGATSTVGQISTQTGTAPPAAGASTAGIKMSSTANLGLFYGSGAPTFSAAQGSVYMRTDGSSTSTRLYVNSNGSTTWVNFTSAS